MQSQYSFIKQFGAKRTLMCELIKRLEQQGKSKMEIQMELFSNEVCKSTDVLTRHFRFYESNKDLIKWV